MRLFNNQLHYTVFKESILHTPSSNVLVESCVMGVSVEVCRDTIWKGLGNLFKMLGDEEEFITAYWYSADCCQDTTIKHNKCSQPVPKHGSTNSELFVLRAQHIRHSNSKDKVGSRIDNKNTIMPGRTCGW